jgi:hypothetical protein
MNYTALKESTIFKEFLDNNISDKNLYQYTYLQNQLESVISGFQNIYSDSLVNIDNQNSNSWILIVNTDSFVSVYGKNWTQSQIIEILQDFDFTDESHSFVMGDKNLILEILGKSEISDFIIGKERNFYRTKKVKSFEFGNYEIKKPSFDNVAELASMLQIYYHEEYKGENDKTIEDMYLRINDLILSDEIFIITDASNKQEIISLCTIKDSSPGILFTKQNYRNRKFGQILLSYTSNKLLEINDEIFLMTDSNVIESNKVCENLGFAKFYEYVSINIS